MTAIWTQPRSWSVGELTTAALMNQLFVNIKVDREERPDLDKIYQTAQQLITQHSGGWPLTMFLMPGDQQPFFGGTYFPARDGERGARVGFRTVLLELDRVYRTDRGRAEQSAEQITNAVRDSLSADAPTGLPGPNRRCRRGSACSICADRCSTASRAAWPKRWRVSTSGRACSCCTCATCR